MPKATKEVERIGLGNTASVPGLTRTNEKMKPSIDKINVDSVPGLSPGKNLKAPKSEYLSKGLGDVEEVPGLSFGKKTSGRKLEETELVRVTEPGYKL